MEGVIVATIIFVSISSTQGGFGETKIKNLKCFIEVYQLLSLLK
jgi:hypothetical protein